MELKDKVILITGASKLLGAEITKQLIINKAKIIAIARNLKLLEELDDFAKTYNTKITIVPMDITNFPCIYELGKIIYNKFGKLDIFIGNAAIVGSSSPVAHFDQKTWNKTFDINFNANWHFIKSFESLLKISKSPRCCFITSDSTEDNRSFFAAYNASKAALKSLAITYSNENINLHIKTNLISLPPLKTSLFNKFLDKEILSANSPNKYVNDILDVITHNERYNTIVNIKN